MTFRAFGKDMQFSVSDLQDEMNRMFQRLWQSGMKVNPFAEQAFSPRVDLCEQPDRFILTAELPGVDLSEIELSYSEGVLSIRGEKNAPDIDEACVEHSVQERRFGPFVRNVTVPAGIDADAISAACKAGVLEVVLPKTHQAQAKSIKVEVKK